MPETTLLRHSLLREEQTTPEGLRKVAAAWRKRYPRSDGYQVRTYHRKLVFDGHEIPLVVVAVLGTAESGEPSPAERGTP